MIIQAKNFKDIKIGDQTSFVRLITADDLLKFADLSGDYNPLHLDDDYAAKTVFGGRVVYGFFLGALVSRLVGMELPGKKSLIIKESLEFKQPAKIGDELTVKGEVVHISQATQLIEVAITINRGEDLLVVGSVYVKILE